jgi:energy-coupling factor transporter ATP-binding protein EcfA2
MSSRSRARSLVAYQDRVILLGRSNSGKSQLARAIFVAAKGPKLIVDPQGSETTRVPGAVTFRDPRRPPDAAVRRFVPIDPADLDAYDEVYRWVLLRSYPSYVWCDEAGDVFPVRRTPPNARRLLTHGRKRQIGHVATHTRPRELDPNLIAQAAHVVVFQLPNPADRRHVADVAGVEPARLDELLGELPPFGYVWHDVAAGTLTAHPPITL